MTTPPDVRLLDDLASLEAVRPAWAALWARIPDAPVFVHPDFSIAWWRAFQPGRLLVLVAFRNDVAVALAPLYLEAGPNGRRVLPLSISIGDHLDILIDPCQTNTAEQAITAALRALDGPTRIDLEDLAPEAAALRLPVPAGWREVVDETSVCPRLDTAGPRDDDGLPFSIPATWRRKVRRARRIAGEMGGLSIRDGAADPAAFFETLRTLHTAEWEARGSPGVLADPRVLAFHSEALPRLAARGLARLRIAEISGRVAGAYYGFACPGIHSAYLGGFDAAAAAASPGMILIADAVVDAATAGARTFDFLRGGEAYKYRWGAVDAPNRRRSLLRAGS